MRVFISGPVSGMPDNNVAAFATAAYRLRQAGHEVYSPVESIPAKCSHEQAMLMCLHELSRGDREAYACMNKLFLEPWYDAMVQLDGWQHSNGARLEAEIADALGIKRASLREVLENPRLPREYA